MPQPVLESICTFHVLLNLVLWNCPEESITKAAFIISGKGFILLYSVKLLYLYYSVLRESGLCLWTCLYCAHEHVISVGVDGEIVTVSAQWWLGICATPEGPILRGTSVMLSKAYRIHLFLPWDDTGMQVMNTVVLAINMRLFGNIWEWVWLCHVNFSLTK